MSSALLVRLRPEGPWRIGPPTGARDRAGRVFHSDSLFSALSHAMAELGWMDEWLSATAAASGAEPAVRVSSVFPSQEEYLLAPPPAHLWPPPAASRLRASGARLIPVTLTRALAFDESWNEDQWEVDPLSECLLRRGRRRAPGAPYRLSMRSHAGVDRLAPGRIEPHQTACIEFAEGAGLWCVALFSGEPSSAVWAPRLKAAMQLLGDTGLGGERHNGWGHFTVERAELGARWELLWGKPPAAPQSDEAEGRPATAPSVPGWWLLSTYSPADTDTVDWSRGNYRLVDRGGRIETRGHGSGALKKASRMVEEGSVLVLPGGQSPRGRAWNVAPDGFPHPVWRAGFAVAVELPWRIPS